MRFGPTAEGWERYASRHANVGRMSSGVSGLRGKASGSMGPKYGPHFPLTDRAGLAVRTHPFYTAAGVVGISAGGAAWEQRRRANNQFNGY